MSGVTVSRLNSIKKRHCKSVEVNIVNRGDFKFKLKQMFEVWYLGKYVQYERDYAV